MRFRPIALLFGAVAAAVPALAQSPDPLAEGRALSESNPKQALARFEQVLASDSLSYEANWRAALALVSIGEETPDSVKSPERDSLYHQAEARARRAVQVDSTDMSGWFALSVALGRSALTKGKRERIRYATEIYQVANRILAANPDHDGAHHVLGLWNAEIMRTSGFTRLLARSFLGGKVLGQASWANAISHLERATELDPSRLNHHLDLARVLAERKQVDAARRELAAIDQLPDTHAGDERYRREAQALGRALAKGES